MKKEAIKKKMIELQNSIIRELQEKVEYSHSMVDIDEGDTIDPEDHSNQWLSGEVEQLMKVQLNKAKGNLVKLNTVNFSPKTRVAPGALVETEKFNFFVGFSMIPFECEGLSIVGISEDSPIYSIMANKKKGDQFSFCGNHYTIKNIY